jgi:hypothetical protein
MSSTSDRAVVTYADQLVKDLSHAQTLAMGWNVRLRLAVSADGSGYAFQCRTVAAGICAAIGSVPTDPASGEVLSKSFGDGVTISPSSGTNSIMDFDTLGRPDINSSLISSNPARSFTLSNSSKSVTVQVQPVTGLASVS